MTHQRTCTSSYKRYLKDGTEVIGVRTTKYYLKKEPLAPITDEMRQRAIEMKSYSASVAAIGRDLGITPARVKTILKNALQS